MQDKIRNLLSLNTGQTYDKIARDTDRDFYLDADQAVEYSLVDEILGKAKADSEEDSKDETTEETKEETGKK